MTVRLKTVTGNISVTASKTNPTPGEMVRFTGTASPIEDIIVNVYDVSGVRIAMYTIYLKKLGVDFILVIPSRLGTVTVWKFKGKDTGATCPDITIRVTAPPPGEGMGVITAVNLPVELNLGDWITGSVAMVNNGEADKMALVIFTEWDGKAYGAVFNLAAGQATDIGIDSGLIVMPSQDAVMTIYACHAQPGGEILINSTEFKIDDTKIH